MAVALIFQEEFGPHDWPIDGPRFAANEERRLVSTSRGKGKKGEGNHNHRFFYASISLAVLLLVFGGRLVALRKGLAMVPARSKANCRDREPNCGCRLRVETPPRKGLSRGVVRRINRRRAHGLRVVDALDAVSELVGSEGTERIDVCELETSRLVGLVDRLIC